MSNKSHDTLRKRKSRENETSEQRETRLSRDCKRKGMCVLRSNDERLNHQDEMTQNIDEGHF